MAAVTMSTPIRQPFASLDAPRLRALAKSRMNIRNQQNGAMTTGKRKPLGDIDTENIDPSLNLSSKRKRASDEEDDDISSKKTSIASSITKPFKAKTSRFALKTVETSPPRISSSIPQPSTPKSAPSLKPAGRSPQSKSVCKPFARRSNITKTTRPEPTSRKSVSRPFSIATALSNGKSSKTASPSTPSTKTPTPASWSFDIHVDSEEEEMTNLMQHSTGVLDISDSKTKQETSSSGRGKENVPPAELGIELPPATAPQQESPAAAARKSVMMEDSRAPLGELNTADYYGADCHAFSYAVVYDEEEETDVENGPVHVQPRKLSASRGSTKPARSTKLSSVSSISSLLESESKSAKSETPEAGVEIWESESAAEETESA